MDVVVFTGGIGENQIDVRRGICKNLSFMGINIDEEKNNIKGEEKEISDSNSKVKVWVIPTNEELMIAKDCLKSIK